MLNRAPSGLAGWISYFRDTEIPVLAATAAAIDALRADEDRVDAQSIVAVVLEDPLMILRVLSHIARKRSSRTVTDLETINSAVLMLGIPPFFREFSSMQTVEAHLQASPAALDGLLRAIARAHRAARFALCMAVHRHDSGAEVIHEAALLHDFVEMLVWCHAPRLMLEIQRRQRADPSLRSAALQREILHVDLVDLEQALMKIWRLPEILTRMTDDHHADVPRVRNVLLACVLARHSQDGWHNPALPDDLQAIAELLNQSPDHVRRKMMDLDGAVEEIEPANGEFVFNVG